MPNFNLVFCDWVSEFDFNVLFINLLVDLEPEATNDLNFSNSLKLNIDVNPVSLL